LEQVLHVFFVKQCTLLTKQELQNCDIKNCLKIGAHSMDSRLAGANPSRGPRDWSQKRQHLPGVGTTRPGQRAGPEPRYLYTRNHSNTLGWIATESITRTSTGRTGIVTGMPHSERIPVRPSQCCAPAVNSERRCCSSAIFSLRVHPNVKNSPVPAYIVSVNSPESLS
jgi:hypothetical protein